MLNNFTYERLFSFCQAVFQSIGCPDEQAIIATESLLAADLRGVDSHGVARLSGYVRLWETGRIKADAKISIVHETPSTALSRMMMCKRYIIILNK
jgi:LDH2 family malate/lactate/ureidoglycolate dehydrogenase